MRPALATLAAALASAGCGPFRALAPGGDERAALRLEVPASRQEGRRECGLSVLEMLAGYYCVPVAPDDLARLREDSRSAGGVQGRTLKEVLERNGFHAYVFAGELLDRHTPRGISYHLERGRPLVVMLDVRGPGRHYAVLTGLDPAADEVFLADPVRGAVRCARAAFLRMWGAAGRFTLLAVPREGAGAAPGGG